MDGNLAHKQLASASSSLQPFPFPFPSLGLFGRGFFNCFASRFKSILAWGWSKKARQGISTTVYTTGMTGEVLRQSINGYCLLILVYF